jgi:SAM-dependent methyltransferase
MSMTGRLPTDGMEEFNRRVDFGRTSSDYARYRAGFPQEFFDRLRRFGIGLPGQRILDLGSGTGTIARGMAAAGCCVTALDPALPQLQEARRLAEVATLDLDPLVAKSETLPLADGSFDVVTAGQCWHWFDRPRAADEVRRVLVDNGALVIAHFDWLPLPGNVVEATERLIEQYNPAWHFGGATGFYPQWVPGLTAAGFQDLETFSFDQEVPYSHEAWRGRTRANAGVAASLSVAEVTRFDEELAQLLAARFPAEPLQVPHRVFAIVARSRAAA